MESCTAIVFGGVGEVPKRNSVLVVVGGEWVRCEGWFVKSSKTAGREGVVEVGDGVWVCVWGGWGGGWGGVERGWGGEREGRRERGRGKGKGRSGKGRGNREREVDGGGEGQGGIGDEERGLG